MAASLHMWIASGLMALFLFAEFFCLIFGVSVMFNQINVVQVILHGLGVLGLIWTVLARWSYLSFDVLGCLTAVLPFLLEVSAMFAAHSKFKVITMI